MLYINKDFFLISIYYKKFFSLYYKYFMVPELIQSPRDISKSALNSNQKNNVLQIFRQEHTFF